jgi:hypothetical protein
MDRNPKTSLEEIFEDDYLTRLGIGVAVAVRWPPSCQLPVVKHASTRSLMVALVDFDFHHSFLFILALFVASVLAIFYLSRLFALALMVYRERVAPNCVELC